MPQVLIHVAFAGIIAKGKPNVFVGAAVAAVRASMTVYTARSGILLTAYPATQTILYVVISCPTIICKSDHGWYLLHWPKLNFEKSPPLKRRDGGVRGMDCHHVINDRDGALEEGPFGSFSPVALVIVPSSKGVFRGISIPSIFAPGVGCVFILGIHVNLLKIGRDWFY